MARSQARIHTSVWRDRDFTALPPDVQGVYWMLLSQPDVSAAGVTALNPMRWCNLMGGCDVTDQVDELARRGFVVYDEHTGELWIRSFARHDGIINSPKTRAAMWSAWDNILSTELRRRFLEELDGFVVTTEIDGEQLEIEVAEEATRRGWITPSELANTRQNTPPDTPSDRAHSGPDTPSHRGFPPARADSDSTSDNDSTTTNGAAAAESAPETRALEVVEQLLARRHDTAARRLANADADARRDLADALDDRVIDGWSPSRLAGEITRLGFDDVTSVAAVLEKRTRDLAGQAPPRAGPPADYDPDAAEARFADLTGEAP